MAAIMRREPLGSLWDELLSDVFARSGFPVAARADEASAAALARMDVVDRGDAYEVSVDLPGVKKEDIHVTIEGARVAISAETTSENVEKNGDKVLRAERTARRYARSFELPVEVTQDGADARLESGVLQLRLPKRNAVAASRLTVR